MYKTSRIWFVLSTLALVMWYIIFPPSLLGHWVLFIWILSGIIVLYRAKNAENKGLEKQKRILVILAGIFFCIFSFISVPMGFGNPPYSISEFAILLSGISLAVFAYLNLQPLVLPASFPLITILGYQIYDLFRENIEWIATPLLDPDINITVFILNLIGINAVREDHIISFPSINNAEMRIPIVLDCTGIWSLGAFTASIILVALVFPRVISKKGFVFISIGYLGTFLANILRIVLICISAYLYEYSAITYTTHIHAGWIAFSVWMIAFWYIFFSRYLLREEPTGTSPKR